MILGNYGTQNTGDEAMLLGLLTELRHFQPKVPISVISRNKLIAAQYQFLQVNVIETRLWDLLRTIRVNSGLILGGGTHFQDDYSINRYLRHLLYMLRYLSIFGFGWILGKQMYLLSMGFGPFRFTITEWITCLIVKLSSQVTVRDQASYQYAIRWKNPTKITVAFDLAALLANKPIGKQRRKKAVHNNSRLGISTLYIGNIPNFDVESNQAFQSSLHEAVRQALQNNPGLEVSIYVFRGAWKRDSDVAVSQGLWERLHNDFSARVSLENYNDPNITLSRMCDLDYFIATRYHSAILAFLADLPTLIISYHLKCKELADTLGLPQEAIINLEEALTGGLSHRVLGLIQNPVSYQAHLTIDEAVASARKNIEILPQIT